MHKLFSILFLVTFYTVLAFGQATVTIPFSCTDGSTTIALAVGLDQTATNCIDPSLGESDLPPFPPPGVFDIRFDLAPYGCPNLSTWLDFRPVASFPFTGNVQHMFWWQVSTPGVSSINITFNLPAGQSMTIVDNITGTLLNLGPFFGSGVAVIPASYTAFGTKAILTMSYTNVIPVELTSFTGTAMQDGVLLNWTTATELNNQGFEIERTIDAQNWQKIGFVPGFGTTTERHLYSFIDDVIDNGTYYYRLKQVDFNGSFTYSEIVEVDITQPLEFTLEQNYPNPFNPSTEIKYQIPVAGFVSLKIYDVLGNEVSNLVNEEKPAGSYNEEINLVNFPSGVYFYTLQAGKFIETRKMILLK